MTRSLLSTIRGEMGSARTIPPRASERDRPDHPCPTGAARGARLSTSATPWPKGYETARASLNAGWIDRSWLVLPPTEEDRMTGIDLSYHVIAEPGSESVPDPAELATASFLARYSARTLEAYRQDLRGFFQWAADAGLPVLDASRAHIELYRVWMEEHGLAASTIDRRLSTVCGFYRFAHIDGRISSNPA